MQLEEQLSASAQELLLVSPLCLHQLLPDDLRQFGELWSHVAKCLKRETSVNEPKAAQVKEKPGRIPTLAESLGPLSLLCLPREMTNLWLFLDSSPSKLFKLLALGGRAYKRVFFFFLASSKYSWPSQTSCKLGL